MASTGDQCEGHTSLSNYDAALEQINDIVVDEGISDSNYGAFSYLIQLIKCKIVSEKDRSIESLHKARVDLLQNQFIISFLRGMRGQSPNQNNKEYHKLCEDMSRQVIGATLLSNTGDDSRQGDGDVMIKSELEKFLNYNIDKLCQKEATLKLFQHYIDNMELEFSENCGKLTKLDRVNHITSFASAHEVLEKEDKQSCSDEQLSVKMEEVKIEYLQMVMKLLSVFEEYVERYQLGDNVRYENLLVSVSKQVSELLAAKSKYYEVNYMRGIYQDNVVTALQRKKNELDADESELDAEIAEARKKLESYEALGERFTQLARKNTSLDSKIDAMKYALKQ